MAAQDSAGTIHALPPACDGSMITGRCVSFFSTATAVTSSTLRYAVSNVRMPRSHRMIR